MRVAGEVAIREAMSFQQVSLNIARYCQRYVLYVILFDTVWRIVSNRAKVPNIVVLIYTRVMRPKTFQNVYTVGMCCSHPHMLALSV